MIAILRGFVKSLPTLILSFALSVAVWISAVNAADPVKQQPYPRAVTIERKNMDPALVVSSDVPTQVSATFSAPSSIWERMLSDRAPVHASIDLSGLGPGTHTVPVKVEPLPQFRPSKLVSQSPQTVSITLEKLVTQEFPVNLSLRGEPAIGFQAETPKLSQDKVDVRGPSSRVQRVKDAVITLDLTQVSDSINRSLDVQVVDANGVPVDGVTFTPKQIIVNQAVSQRGGYRNVVVKVGWTGQVANGYRLTNISVFPPTVTVFSSNPQLVDRLPGFVETNPIDLTGVKDDIDRRLSLNLPNGVEVVGDQTDLVDQKVLVQVGVATIEGNVTLSGLPIQKTGVDDTLDAHLSPETVDVIISGPVPLLDRISEADVRVSVDVTGVGEGTYQFAPKVVLAIAELQVESILPSSIEVVVGPKTNQTATPTASPAPQKAPTPTLTPTPRR